MGYGRCNLFSPHPSPLPGGEGTLNGVFFAILSRWIPACAGKTVRGGFAFGVGEAVADQVFCCVHSVADFDAGGLAPHCFREEARDVFTVFGEAVNLVLYVCWVAHRL